METDFMDMLQKQYNYSSEAISKIKVTNNELNNIYTHYLSIKEDLYDGALYIVKRLQKYPVVHSVKYRIKDELHLIEKIARKSIEEPERVISQDNYISEIKDLIGIRFIHLFKEDCVNIDKLIRSFFQQNEKPIVYIREGDTPFAFFNDNSEYEIKTHCFGYRSIHYIVDCPYCASSKYAEIQVRTIFEEGWSEIDHNLRYPYYKDDETLSDYLLIFNRFAGTADEMGSFIKKLKIQISEFKKNEDKLNSEIDLLKEKIESLKVKKEEKTELLRGLDKVDNYNKSISSNIYSLNINTHTINDLDKLSAFTREHSLSSLASKALVELGLTSQAATEFGLFSRTATEFGLSSRTATELGLSSRATKLGIASQAATEQLTYNASSINQEKPEVVPKKLSEIINNDKSDKEVKKGKYKKQKK